MKIVLFISAIVLLSAAFVAWMAYNAPEGYEDDDGFHETKKKD